MTKVEASSSGGISVLGLLGVAFIVLKLCGVIDWSWWWVTAPFWIGIAIFAAVILACGIIAGCIGLGAVCIAMFARMKRP